MKFTCISSFQRIEQNHTLSTFITEYTDDAASELQMGNLTPKLAHLVQVACTRAAGTTVRWTAGMVLLQRVPRCGGQRVWCCCSGYHGAAAGTMVLQQYTCMLHIVFTLKSKQQYRVYPIILHCSVYYELQ